MLGGHNWKELEGWSCSLLRPGKTARGGGRGVGGEGWSLGAWGWTCCLRGVYQMPQRPCEQDIV